MSAVSEDSFSNLIDTHDANQIGQSTLTVDGEQRLAKLTQNKKASGLMSRRGGNLSLSMKLPCVEKQASPLKLLEDRYKIFEKLGSGCAGTVHRAVHLESGDELALKIPRTSDHANTAAAEHEYNLLKSLEPHPNIIRVFDFHNLKGEATLVLEFFDGISLQAAANKKGMPEATARTLCIALFNAVDHLHDNNIIHRDIKPQNILVSRCQQDLRLIDFNVAACLDNGTPLTPTGTELYKAPELLFGDIACERSDVWSSGLCIFFMLSGSLPQGRNSTEFHVSNEEASAPVQFSARCWQHVSEECKDMLRRCLDTNRQERPLMADLLNDAWISDPLMRRLSMLTLVVPGADAYLSVLSTYFNSDAMSPLRSSMDSSHPSEQGE
jgi:serine/threonine protein kinase